MYAGNELVSIVVPVYNVEHYVRRCLDSLIRQTYPNIEILVIEDGSTDSSREVCEEIARKDQRIRLLTQENRGLAAVRNRGIAEAKGDYLIYVDSDDLIAPSYTEETLRICKEHDADIVATGYFSFINEEQIPRELGPEEIRLLTGREACYALFDDSVPNLGVAMKFFKMSILSDAHFPEGKLHEDEFVMYRLYYRAKRVAVTSRKLYDYQSKRPDSITHASYSLRRLDGVDAARGRVQFFREEGEEELAEKSEAALLSSILRNIDEMEPLKNGPENNYPEKQADALMSEAKFLIKRIWKSKYLRFRRKVNLTLHLYWPSLWKRSGLSF